MPEQTQQEYMNINDFAREFIDLIKSSNSWPRANFTSSALVKLLDGDYSVVVSVPREEQGHAMRYVGTAIDNYFAEHKNTDLYIAPAEKVIFPQVARALREYPAPQAKKFIDMMRIVASVEKDTFLLEKEDQISFGMLLKSIESNVISDPEVQYFYLSRLVRRIKDKDILNEAWYMLAKHPNAKLTDLMSYAGVCKKEELEGVYSRAEKIVDAKIESVIPRPEQGQFGDPDELKKLLDDSVKNLYSLLNEIMYHFQDDEFQVQKFRIIQEMLPVKYDLKTILDFRGGSYFEEFEKSLSSTAAEMSQENQDLRAQVNTLTESRNALKTEKDHELAQLRSENGRLQSDYNERITELEKENKNLKEKLTRFLKLLDAKLGLIKMFFHKLHDIEGQTFNRGRDLIESAKGLEKSLNATDPQTQYNWMTDMEAEITKMKRQQMEAQGRPRV